VTAPADAVASDRAAFDAEELTPAPVTHGYEDPAVANRIVFREAITVLRLRVVELAAGLAEVLEGLNQLEKRIP
jgi:hypothetical protein